MPLQDLKVNAVFSILIFGVIGASAPILFTKIAPSRASQQLIDYILKVMTSAATGVILATGLMHMLADSIEDLGKFSIEHSNPGNPYPFAIFFTLLGALFTYILSTEMNYLAVRRINDDHHNQHVKASDLKSEEGGAKTEKEDRDEEGKRRCALIRLWVLEVAIAVHSVVIGLAVGVSGNSALIKTLTIALSIHQALEGLAVGSLVVESQVDLEKAIFFVVTFATTTPAGVLLGMWVQNDVNQVLQGVLSGIGAGILIESGFVEMLPSILPPVKADSCGTHHTHGLPSSPIKQVLHTAVTSAEVPPAKTYGTLHFDTNSKQNGVTSIGENPPSGSMRLICYLSIFIGAGAQAIMAIWA